jgi:hypothetical protein
MSRLNFLLPIIPACIVVYFTLNDYLYYTNVLISTLDRLGITDFYISINDGASDYLHLYLANTYLLLGVSLLFIILTVVNTAFLKKIWAYNLWVIYTALALILLANSTTYFTAIKYGVRSYEELQRKDKVIEKLQNGKTFTL